MKVVLFILVAALPWKASAGELDLVFRYGKPINGRTAASVGRVEFASWIDNEHIVYALRGGDVACLSITSREVKWALSGVGKISDWSVSRKVGRLAYLTDNDVVSVIDCTNGNKLFTADQDRLATLLRCDFALPCRLALAPDDGRLIVSTFSTCHGRNAYVLDPTYKKLLSSFDVDASPNEVTLSPKGDRVAVVADEDVLCVRDLAEKRDVFFRGTRIKEEPDSLTIVIDAPFFSHLRDGGGDEVVYTLDNSWATGKVFVHNIKTDEVESFDSRNGHVELDVSFDTRRIALTGTSTDVTVLDFEGNVLAHKQNATLQRNSCVSVFPHQETKSSWEVGTIPCPYSPSPKSANNHTVHAAATGRAVWQNQCRSPRPGERRH